MQISKSIAWPLLIFVILHGSSAGAQTLEQTFSEDISRFKITSPNDQWKFPARSVSPGPVRATLRFKFPVNQFLPNVTVRVRALGDKTIKLNEWIDQDLGKMPEDVEVLAKNEIKPREVPGVEILFQDKSSKLQFLQWIFLANEKSYVLTCIAPISTWARFEKDFKKILNSFEIL